MTAFTPGSYIAARRRAQSMSIDDVADAIDTEPHVSAISRRAMIAMVEADLSPISSNDVACLRSVFPFDIEVLNRLVDLHVYKADLPAPRLCRICGCSDLDACITPGVGGSSACSWIDADLCSACPQSSSVSVPSPISSSRGAS